jgi:hypothetical protein
MAAVLFITILLHTKHLFNPSNWLGELQRTDRVVPIELWDAEIYACPDSEFSQDTCQSISGSFVFERVRLPLSRQLRLRMAELAEGATHLRLRHTLSLQDQKWIELRQSEEFLRPELVFFRNHRCFAASGTKPYCGQRSESFGLADIMKDNSIEMVFPIGPSTSFGPGSLSPFLIESHLLSRVLALEDRATAAFATEGVLLATILVFFAALAMLFPWHAPTVLMFAFCLLKVTQTSLSYAVETQGVDSLFALLGSQGYTIVSIALHAAILMALLYLTAATLKGSYALSKLEAGYGLGLTAVFVVIASFYSKMGELDVAALFARDAIATLFGAIWIMYHLLSEWSHNASATHEAGSSLDPSYVRQHLKTFVYLFFLVSYGAAGAQTVLGIQGLPDLLPWQTLFFVPGLGLAVLLDLSIAQRAQRQGIPVVLGGVKIQSEMRSVHDVKDNLPPS